MALKTFTTGEVLTAADVNLYLVNNIFARKSSLESVTSSTTLQDDDVLSVSVAANSKYLVDMIIRYDGATTGDLNFQLVAPAGASFDGVAHRINSGASTTTDHTVSPMTESNPISAGALGAGTTLVADVRGLLFVSATAGTFKLQWAQLASDATATRVVAGSYMVLRRVD